MSEFDFLESRRDWLEIQAVDNPAGGWDVVLRLDGTYFIDSQSFKEGLLGYFEEQLAGAMSPEAEEEEEPWQGQIGC